MKKPTFKEYSKDVELQMLLFHGSLNERSRRQYAALEAKRLGYGGKAYIARVLDIDSRTITRGISELEGHSCKCVESNKVRIAGGGRKKKRTLS